MKKIILAGVILLSCCFSEESSNQLCEQNKRKIEDAIMSDFKLDSHNSFGKSQQVTFCEGLRDMYPQMPANECQVVAKRFFDEYRYSVKDEKNLPTILKKYIFKVELQNEVSTPEYCVSMVSVKFKYDINDAVIEKIKTMLKNRNDEHKLYLRFMNNDKEFEMGFRDDILLRYRFWGDKLVKNFDKYYEQFYWWPYKEIAYYSGYYMLPIEYEVVDFARIEKITYKYWDTYRDDCEYDEKKSEIDLDKIVEVKYDKEIKSSHTFTCGELKRRLDYFDPLGNYGEQN